MTKWFTQTPIAHRGWHWEEGVDENSWEAIELGIEKGFPIEFDLHLSKDGMPYIHHDHNLKRMTGRDILGTELKGRELKKQKTHHSAKGIPLLAEVLKFVRGRIPLVIELKHTAASAGLVGASLSYLSDYKGEYALQSFHPQLLIELKKGGCSAPLGMLSGDLSQSHLSSFSRVLLKSLCLAPFLKPDYIGYQWDCLSQRAPQEIRRRYGIPLLGWTVKNDKERAFCEQWADGIIGENIL